MSLRLRACLVLCVGAAALLGSASGMGAIESANAIFNRGLGVGSNSISSGSWAFYLHNNPTPPTANTTAQYNLTMTITAPTATTLHNYDTDSANRPGRGVTRANPPSAGLTTAHQYVNWRTPVLANALTLTGSVTVDFWSATNTATANRTGSLIAYLRDYNPTAGTYVEIANATYTGAYAVGRTYYERPITIAATATVAAGHQLEVKLESPRATSQNNMLVAYDTTAYPSILRVR